LLNMDKGILSTDTDGEKIIKYFEKWVRYIPIFLRNIHYVFSKKCPALIIC
jgi:hypothetical protein